MDSAKLIYFILQPDAQFLRQGNDAYVQAKLEAIEPEDDDDQNGEGVAPSSVVLYKVSEDPAIAQKAKDLKKKRKKKKQKRV